MQAVIIRFIALVATMTCLTLPVLADESLREFRPRPLAWAMEAMRRGDWDSARQIAARDGQVALDIIEWARLRGGSGTYAEVSAFLATRPDWPGLEYLRKQSEAAVITEGDAAIATFFKDIPAQTVDGILAHAKVLSRTGQEDRANKMIVDMWLDADMSGGLQQRVLNQYGNLLKSRHADRLDRMLWKRWHKNARAVFDLVPESARAAALARIALQNRSSNANDLLSKLPAAAQSTPGMMQARFEWRVRKGRWSDAKDLLLAQSISAESLGQPSAWANRRRELARDELRDGSARRAYHLASRHFLTSGSHYADLEWLSGYIALTRLGDAETALQHFQNHDDAVVSPISQGRAGYWKGRAHQALGDAAAADMEFNRGAAYQTSFYGLLAAEAIGAPFDVGLNDVPQENWRNSPLARDQVFQAGLLLAASAERNLAERFWVHLAGQLAETDAALLGQAAIDAGEPHLAVMIGKAVARRGDTIPLPYYPLHPLAGADLQIPTEMALSIARRESEFDPVVVSGAGAQGLMQLMPATAKEVAGDLGLSDEHSKARLTKDPVYNGRLGTKYLADLAQRFDGNVIMVSAGYNAGPSRPIRWMEKYGDPRGKGLDATIDWIEGIPFRETRNYVMRVSESLPIYRARLGQTALPVPFSAELQGGTLSE